MTLEKLIETLRGIDGPVTLQEDQVRALVAWFETARNSVGLAERRRGRIDELSQANLRLEEDITKAVEAEREAIAELVRPEQWADTPHTARHAAAVIQTAIRTRGGR